MCVGIITTEKKSHYLQQLQDLIKIIFETKTGIDFEQRPTKVAERIATRSHHREERGMEIDNWCVSIAVKQSSSSG